jgi:hypothetical protein
VTLAEPYALIISRALTGKQRAAIVKRFTALNPSWVGAKAADILDELDQADSDLEVTEPFWETHPDLDGTGLGIAARALIWSGTPLTRPNIRALVAAAGIGYELTGPVQHDHGFYMQGPAARTGRKS